MREECKHFQSRTYSSGEVARFCVLDLAPEAPWRCPADCARYERRLADAGWAHGQLVEPAIEDEPDGSSAEIASLLDQAEGIVNAVGPAARAEAEARERAAGRAGGRWWQRIRRPGPTRRAPSSPDDLSS
jgi:hypothetical protein